MAKTAMKLKAQRTPKYSTRAYTRCERCGRPHSVLRKYKICGRNMPVDLECIKMGNRRTGPFCRFEDIMPQEKQVVYI